MSWVEAFNLFVVCHLIGDFLLQTEFQAINKHGGLGLVPPHRRALTAHIVTYAAPFVPATVYIGAKASALAWVAFVLIAVTHFVQDDGRILKRYVARVKKTDPPPGGMLWVAIDQSFHIATLFALALLATA